MTDRPEAHNARDHTADALAFIKATYLGDGNGRAAVARNCDPAGMVDSLAALVCSLLVVGGLDPLGYLDGMLAGVASTSVEDWPTR